MRKVVVTIAGAMLLALAGCSGSSNPSSSGAGTTTNTQTGAGTKPASTSMTLSSSAVVRGKLAARYTCDGQNISPPMDWSHVPADTKSLVLFVFGLTPEPHGNTSEVSFEWTLDGIKPALGGLVAGTVPAGAHVGRGSGRRSRYSICPKSGETKEYEFALYPVPSTLQVPGKFLDVQLLHLLTTTPSGLSANVSTGASFVVTYTRK